MKQFFANERGFLFVAFCAITQLFCLEGRAYAEITKLNDALYIQKEHPVNINVPIPLKEWWVNDWGSLPTLYEDQSITNPSTKGLPFEKIHTFQLNSMGNGHAHLIRSFTANYGETYQLTLFARSEKPTARVTFALRYDAKPYNCFGSHTLDLTNQWKKITVHGVYPYKNEKNASVRVIPHNVGNRIFVGGASLMQVAPMPMKTGSQNGASLPDSFFGMVVNKLGVHNNWPNLNTQLIRLWDTGTNWAKIQPSKNAWSFKRADYYIDYAEKNGAKVMFTLGQTPAWATNDPKVACAYGVGCSPPSDIENWRIYVRTLAQRYGKRVQYWELWNEPDYSGFWHGTAEQMAILAKIAKEEIKKVNQRAWLIGPSITNNGILFLDRFLAAGGGDAIDAVSFHAYYSSNNKDLINSIDNVSYIMRQHELEYLPLWNTEAGIAFAEEQSDETNSNDKQLLLSVPRALFTIAAKGLYGSVFYNWERQPPHTPLALSDPDQFKQLTQAGLIYQQATDLLINAKIENAYYYKDLFILHFEKDNIKKVAVWTDKSEKKIVLPKSWPYKIFTLFDTEKKIAFEHGGSIALSNDMILIGSEI